MIFRKLCKVFSKQQQSGHTLLRVVENCQNISSKTKISLFSVALRNKITTYLATENSSF
jgi:hypothetical protein